MPKMWLKVIWSRSVTVLQNKKLLKMLSAAKNEAVLRFEMAEDASCALMLLARMV